jgi:peptide/nickel transport system permease protein
VRAFARLIAGRLAQVLVVATAIAVVTFAFVELLPGDTALRIAGARFGEERATAEAAARVRIEEGLDRPALERLASWAARVATLDLGVSLVSRKPVLEELARALSYTLGLGLVGWLASWALAVPLGVWSGLHPGGAIDRLVTALAVAISAMPAFLLAILLVGVFSIALKLLPPAGFRTPAHLVLPAATLALGLAASGALIVRAAVLEVRAAGYVAFARVRGMPPATIALRHGARNAAIPVATYAALQFAFLVDGFVVIETVFAYPGVGDLLVKALLSRDVPVIMGAGLAIGVLYALLSLLADLAALVLDPRRRAETVA